MNIMHVEVEWYEKYANDPMWIVHVDKAPRHADLIYHHYAGTSLHVAEDPSGYVSYFSYMKPDRGFGGREFELNMDDGSVKTLVGPWSSRAAAVNALTPHKVVDCVIQEADGKERYNVRYSGAIACFVLMMHILKSQVIYKSLTDIGAMWVREIGRRDVHGRVQMDEIRLTPCHRDPESGRLTMKSNSYFGTRSRELTPVQDVLDIAKLNLGLNPTFGV